MHWLQSKTFTHDSCVKISLLVIWNFTVEVAKLWPIGTSCFLSYMLWLSVCDSFLSTFVVDMRMLKVLYFDLKDLPSWWGRLKWSDSYSCSLVANARIFAILLVHLSYLTSLWSLSLLPIEILLSLDSSTPLSNIWIQLFIFLIFWFEYALASLWRLPETDMGFQLISWLRIQDISNKGGLAARDWFDKRLSPR